MVIKKRKSGDIMKKGHIKILSLEIVFLLFLILDIIFFKIANPYILALIIFLVLVATIFLIGFEKANFRYQKDVFLNIIICLLVYFFITYFLGLFTGFLKNSYSLRFINIIRNTAPVLIIIIISELLRYSWVSKSKENKLFIVLGYIAFVLIDVCLMLNTYDITNALGLTKMICLVVFPSITKNILLTYLAYNFGYKNNIFYRIIMDLSTYVVPIFPDFGEYINVMLQTVLPIFLVVKINNLFNYFETRKIKDSRYNKRKLTLYSVITLMLFVIVTLTSGYFRYYALTIGSSSMSPSIDKGDIVIVEKLNKDELPDIKKGDILVYNQENRIIVHRVNKILKTNDEIVIRTKGDNNDSVDSWQVKEDQIIGIVKFKIKYFGMPTVALNELLNG